MPPLLSALRVPGSRTRLVVEERTLLRKHFGIEQSLGPGEVVGEAGERGEPERSRAVGRILADRREPAGGHGRGAVIGESGPREQERSHQRA